MKLINKNKNGNNLIVSGDIQKIKGNMYVYLIEVKNNKKILDYIKDKYNVVIELTEEKRIYLNGIKYYKVCEICGKGEIYSASKWNNTKSLLTMLNICHVILIAKVKNIQRGLEIVDEVLSTGKEIICIKGPFSKDYYVSNYLIKNGAKYI